MCKYILLILLIAFNVEAKEINQKYSNKDFTNKSFKHLDASEFNNTIIKNSVFYQECLLEEEKASCLKDIFPDGMIGVDFKRTNLDNVDVPLGNTLDKKCSNKKIKVQNDLEDWILDDNFDPVEPTSKKHYLRLGIDIDPKKIPNKKLDKNIMLIKEAEIEEDTIIIGR